VAPPGPRRLRTRIWLTGGFGSLEEGGFGYRIHARVAHLVVHLLANERGRRERSASGEYERLPKGQVRRECQFESGRVLVRITTNVDL
jgi:hypothetical protein